MDYVENIASCAICQEMYVKPSCLPCGHVFCADCLTEHLSRSRLCPMCRTSVGEHQQPTLLHGFDDMLNLLEANLPLNNQQERQARKQLAEQGSLPRNQQNVKSKQDPNPSAYANTNLSEPFTRASVNNFSSSINVIEASQGSLILGPAAVSSVLDEPPSVFPVSTSNTDVQPSVFPVSTSNIDVQPSVFPVNTSNTNVLPLPLIYTCNKRTVLFDKNPYVENPSAQVMNLSNGIDRATELTNSLLCNFLDNFQSSFLDLSISSTTKSTTSSAACSNNTGSQSSRRTIFNRTFSSDKINGGTYKGCTFLSCTLINCTLRNCVSNSCTLKDCLCEETNVRSSTLKRSTLIECYNFSCTLKGCVCTRCSFVSCILKYCNPSMCSYTSCSVKGQD